MKKSECKIVFTDAGTLDYGDVSFKELQARGSFQSYHRTLPPEAEARLAGADIIITNKFPIHGDLMRRLPKLRLICVAATGVNIIDLPSAKTRGIAVANVAGYSTESVVQLTFAFILSLASQLPRYDRAAHDGTWSASPFFMFAEYPIMEVAGKTLAVVGYGTIGCRVGVVAKALGMNVLAAKIPGRKYTRDKVKRVPLEEAMKTADFVSVHAPLSELTKDLIGASLIAKMKRGSFLINMARGGIVNEKALLEALESGKLAGAASDVLTQEPPPRDHILLKAPNLLLTPHIAWASQEARMRLIHEIAENIRAFQAGRKRNRIV